MPQLDPYRGPTEVVVACKSCQFRELASSRAEERKKDFWRMVRHAGAVPYRHGPFVAIISYLSMQYMIENPSTPGIWAGLSALGMVFSMIGTGVIFLVFMYGMICAFVRLSEDDLTDDELLWLYAARQNAEKKVLPSSVVMK